MVASKRDEARVVTPEKGADDPRHTVTPQERRHSRGKRCECPAGKVRSGVSISFPQPGAKRCRRTSTIR